MNIPKNTEYILGCDPDSKYQAFAVIHVKTGKLVDAFTIRSKTSDELVQSNAHASYRPATEWTCEKFFAVVEGQKVYTNDKKSNPVSLIKLARASGIACAWLGSYIHCNGIHIALPQEWKGSKQKHAHQAQIIKKLGLTPEIKGTKSARYAIPKEGLLDLTATELKHVIDAVGMAMWARDSFLWELKKEHMSK